MKNPPHEKYSLAEELFNCITHGIGIGLSIAGLAVLAVVAARQNSAWHIVTFTVYGVTLFLLYLASTLYHAFKPTRAKRVFRIFDHASIFLLIAGTYTPFTLVSLKGPVGWALFGIIWTLALLGILQKAISLETKTPASVIIYLAMGWAIVFAFKPLLENVAIEGILLLALGGLAYTAGTIFYSMRRLKFNHGIWHLFVMAGSILHYFAVLFYVR
jgi:hemolysin III